MKLGSGKKGIPCNGEKRVRFIAHAIFYTVLRPTRCIRNQSKLIQDHNQVLLFHLSLFKTLKYSYITLSSMEARRRKIHARLVKRPSSPPPYVGIIVRSSGSLNQKTKKQSTKSKKSKKAKGYCPSQTAPLN
jgi:hypothetical protein